MNMYNNIVLAKPSGITLEQHVFDVMTEADMILSNTSFVVEKYQQIVGKDLRKRLEIVCKLHDDGKSNPKWQNACRKDYDNYLKGRLKNKDTKPDGNNIQRAGIRHEFQSLVINKSKNLPLSLQCAIAAHHSKLGFAYESRWVNEGVANYWNTFRRESNKVIETDSLETVCNSFFFFF